MQGQNKKRMVTQFFFLMTLLAGATNVYAVEILNMPVTHHTGNLSHISINFFRDYGLFQQLILTVISYSIGAFISGRHYQKDGKPGRKHAYLLILSALFLLSFKLLGLKSVMTYLISMVAGIQNTISVTYKGMKIRITHMTGYLADLGQHVASWSKGSKEGKEKAILIFISILTFVLGGFIGYGISRFDQIALYILSALYLLTGLFLIRILENFQEQL